MKIGPTNNDSSEIPFSTLCKHLFLRDELCKVSFYKAKKKKNNLSSILHKMAVPEELYFGLIR